MSKLDDNVIYDKSVRYLNKLIRKLNDDNLENELNKTKIENTYGKCLLDIEKLNSSIENDKFDLNSLIQRNQEKQIEINKIESEIKETNTLFSQKERKISFLTRKIDEVYHITTKFFINFPKIFLFYVILYFR